MIGEVFREKLSIYSVNECNIKFLDKFENEFFDDF